MRVALAFPGCHRRGGVERVMLECSNYLASKGHVTHSFAIDWDDAAVDTRVIKHLVSISSKYYITRLAGFIRQSGQMIAGLSPAPDVLAGFGIESPDNSVVWMQSVHKAWLEVSAKERNLTGRLKQKLNPAHTVILALEKKRFSQRRYRKVVALSARVKADIVRFYAVPDSDIVVVPNGFSPTEFSIDQRERFRVQIRSKLGFSDSDRVVIFVANELERKGFYPLLQAVSRLDCASTHLLAVGRLNRATYAAEIERLGMTGRVHWTGPSSSVAEYYASADLFVLPTQYEAWGLVIVEAMACGLPVVTSRLAGASIAICEDRTGKLLDSPHNPDEIVEAMRPWLGRNRPDAGFISESVADYAWNRVLSQYEDILEAASSKKSPMTPQQSA